MGTELGVSMDDDVFSSAEQSFFESAGKITEGLIPAGTTTPEPQAKTGESEPKPQPKTGEDDEPVEGEVEVGADGRVRDPKSGRFVPAGLLRETRQALKSTKGELQELRATNAKFLEILNRAVAPQQARAEPQKTEEAPKLIDPSVDPVGAIQQERELREKAEKARAESEKKITEQIAQSERRNALSRDVGTFRAKTPDFDDAMKHLTQVREQHYGLLYAFRNPDGTPNTERIRQQVMSDLQGVMDDALEGKASAGQALYEWAKTFGYQKKGAATVDPAKAAAEAAAAAKTSAERTAAEQTLEAVGSGMGGARTLATTGGGVSSGGLTQEALANMSDAELDSLADKLRSNPALQAEINRALGAR